MNKNNLYSSNVEKINKLNEKIVIEAIQAGIDPKKMNPGNHLVIVEHLKSFGGLSCGKIVSIGDDCNKLPTGAKVGDNITCSTYSLNFINHKICFVFDDKIKLAVEKKENNDE